MAKPNFKSFGKIIIFIIALQIIGVIFEGGSASELISSLIGTGILLFIFYPRIKNFMEKTEQKNHEKPKEISGKETKKSFWKELSEASKDPQAKFREIKSTFDFPKNFEQDLKHLSDYPDTASNLISTKVSSKSQIIGQLQQFKKIKKVKQLSPGLYEITIKFFDDSEHLFRIKTDENNKILSIERFS